MKRYLNNFKFTEKFMMDCILECLSHKTGKVIRWNRKDTSYFLAEYYIKGDFTDSENIHKVAEFIRDDIDGNFIFYHDVLVPYIAKEMIEEIKNRNIQLKPIVYQKRIDSSSDKIREIGITSIKQQVYDYICVNALKPMLNAKIGYYQCSSIKGRGQKHAKKAVEKCIRKKYKRARIVIKSDIKKCYQSIKHDILFKLLNRDVKNKDVLYVVAALVSTYSDNGMGLCIGTYLSQYLANYYLSYVYHFATEKVFMTRRSKRTGEIKKIRPFIKVVFYMDDMVFIGSNKKYMKKAMRMIIKYLKEKLDLDLKHDTYQVIDLFRHNSFIDFVGYRFYRDHTSIRRKIFYRICADVNNIRKYGNNVGIKACRGFMSRHGFVKHSDSAEFKRRYKYDMAYQIAKGAISNEAKNALHGNAARCKVQ